MDARIPMCILAAQSRLSGLLNEKNSDTKSGVGSEVRWIWEELREELGNDIIKESHKQFFFQNLQN